MDLFYGFLLGILATLVYDRAKLFVKPNIFVSSQLAYSQDVSSNGHILRLKLFNRSNRLITDINCYASISFLEDVPNGFRSKGKHWPALRQPPLFLGPAKNLGQPYGLSPVSVLSFSLTDEMYNDINGGMKFLFTISMVDAITGTKDARRMAYDKKDIACGKFEGSGGMQIY